MYRISIAGKIFNKKGALSAPFVLFCFYRYDNTIGVIARYAVIRILGNRNFGVLAVYFDVEDTEVLRGDIA